MYKISFFLIDDWELALLEILFYFWVLNLITLTGSYYGFYTNDSLKFSTSLINELYIDFIVLLKKHPRLPILRLVNKLGGFYYYYVYLIYLVYLISLIFYFLY